MNRIRLDESVVVGASRPPTSEFAALVAEVSERLVEMRDKNAGATWKWIRCLNRILCMHEGETALYVYLLLQTGDFSALTNSMSTIGQRGCRSKQAVQQELERATADLVVMFPELAAAIHELRQSVKDYAA